MENQEFNMEKVYSPSQIEDRIYEKWESSGAFKPVIDPAKKPFTIVMPPPNITGQLHIGHALDEMPQDVLIRYHRMKGDPTLWVPGTDHAAIATEVKVVESLAKEGLTKYDIGREKFLERTWEWKKEYGGPDLGRLVVTTFGNPWQVMIRFDTGDLVRIHKDPLCSCGIDNGFVCDTIEGRVSNSTFTPEGGLVTTAMADRALSGVPGVREYDLCQTGKKSYVLTLEIRGSEKDAKYAAFDAMRSLYGEKAEIEILFSPRLLPGPAGKYRRTHAEFAFDEWSLTEGEHIIA